MECNRRRFKKKALIYILQIAQSYIPESTEVTGKKGNLKAFQLPWQVFKN